MLSKLVSYVEGSAGCGHIINKLSSPGHLHRDTSSGDVQFVHGGKITFLLSSPDFDTTL